VRGPASLGAPRDKLRVCVEGDIGPVDEELDVCLGEVSDAEAFDDGIFEESLLGGGRRVHFEVLLVFLVETFGGVGGVCEGARVPDVFGVRSMKFWKELVDK
jgi:hypothetical protein